MGVRVPHQVSAPTVELPAAPHRDVLVSGEQVRWSQRWSAGPRRTVAGGVGLAVAVAAAVSLPALTDAPGPVPVADPVRIQLHPHAVVVPRHLPPEPGRAAVAGLHVELVNAGERTLVLRSASLVPGAWQVEIADRHELRPGWSAVLDLHREVDCGPDADADAGPVPRDLVLEAVVDGRVVVREVDVGPGQVAYSGRLDDVLGSPGDACDFEAGSPLLGPIGDLFPIRRRPPGI